MLKRAVSDPKEAPVMTKFTIKRPGSLNLSPPREHPDEDDRPKPGEEDDRIKAMKQCMQEIHREEAVKAARMQPAVAAGAPWCWASQSPPGSFVPAPVMISSPAAATVARAVRT